MQVPPSPSLLAALLSLSLHLAFFSWSVDGRASLLTSVSDCWAPWLSFSSLGGQGVVSACLIQETVGVTQGAVCSLIFLSQIYGGNGSHFAMTHCAIAA